MRANIAEKGEKITDMEQTLAKTDQQYEETKMLFDMQNEENKNLKQHVHKFVEENNSLKKLVEVLKTDVAKLDELEDKVE